MSRNQHGDWKTQITAVKEKLIHSFSVDANSCCEDLEMLWDSFNGCLGEKCPSIITNLLASSWAKKKKHPQKKKANERLKKKTKK